MSDDEPTRPIDVPEGGQAPPTDEHVPVEVAPQSRTQVDLHPADDADPTRMGPLDQDEVRAAFAEAAAVEVTAVYNGPLPRAATPPPPASSSGMIELAASDLESAPDLDDFRVAGADAAQTSEILAPARKPPTVRPPPPTYEPPPRNADDFVAPAYAIEPDGDERQLQDEGRFGALLDLYRLRLADADMPSARAALLHKISSVLEYRMNQREEAFDALVQAFEIRPTDGAVALSLDRVGGALDRLGEVCERAIKALHTADPETRVALLGNVIYWYERRLGRGAEAGRFISELERFDKSHPVVLRRLAQAAAASGDAKGQRELLVRALEGSARTDEKVALHVAIAAASAGSPDALAHVEAAVSLDPGSLPALQALERLGREQEKHAQIAWSLERQIEVVPATPDRVAVLLALAELQETKFVRRDDAAALLECVLEIEPANPTALKALERCYHALRDWQKLARTLRTHAEHTYDKKEQVELLTLAVEVYESKLSDAAGAIDTYRDLLHVDPTHRRALSDLSRLYERLGDWGNVATYKAKVAELATSKKQTAQLLVQLGDFLAAPERDPLAAQLQYERAAQVDPTCAPAWQALQAIATAAGDDRRVIQCLGERARHTEGPRQRAAAYVELASLHESRAEPKQALEAFEGAIKADPTNEIAGKAMLQVYARDERWAEASPLCDLLVNAAVRDKDADSHFTLLRLQTRIAAALADAERAMSAALGALEIHPDDIEAQADLVFVSSQCRDKPAVVARAKEWIARIALDPRGLGPEGLVRLAQLQRDAGDVDAAAQTLERAATDDAAAPAILEELSQVYLAQGDFPRACKLMVDMARNTIDPKARFKRLVEAGEVWARKAQELEKAASVFEEARLLEPLDSWLLHTLMSLYGQLERWDALTSVLDGIAQLQDTPAAKAKSLFTSAQVVRDKLHDIRRAADLFDQVLDADKTRLDAFEELVRSLTEVRDWEGLERAYRKMIARIQGDSDRRLEFALFQQLGLIYRDRVGDAERAYEAFSAAGRMRPDDTEVRKILMELLVVTDNLDLAVTRTRELITFDPHNADLYEELYELFLRQHLFDKAWCALNVLTRFREPTQEHRRFHEDYAPMPLAQVPGQIVEEAWRSHVFHPDLDPLLTSIFALMTPAVARMRHAQLRPEQRVVQPLSHAHSRLYEAIRATFGNAAEILALAPPELHLGDPTSPLPLSPALAPLGATLVGVPALEARGDMLPYLVGKRLAEQRPELAARAFLPSVPDLIALLAAAVRLARQEGARDPASAALDASLAAMITPDEVNAIRAVVLQATMEGGRVDVKRWSQAADLSSTRAGLLVCGDVEFARKSIAAEPQGPTDLPPRERLGELYKFATSDLYSDLRGAIGIAVRE